VEPLPACDASPGVSDSLLCEDYTVTFGLAEDFLPKLSRLNSVPLNQGGFAPSTYLSWAHSVVLLNEGAPFVREFNIDVRFVQLLVGDLHIGNAFVRSDVQSATAFKTVHTANSSLLLLVYGGALVHVVHGSPGLTTEIAEP